MSEKTVSQTLKKIQQTGNQLGFGNLSTQCFPRDHHEVRHAALLQHTADAGNDLSEIMNTALGEVVARVEGQ